MDRTNREKQELLRQKAGAPKKRDLPAGSDRRSQEEIDRDIRVFAEKNPRRGALHELDRTRAQDKHAIEKHRVREEMVPEASGEAPVSVSETGYCRTHPSSPTSWRCADCGREFCEACVTPLRHILSNEHRAAVCPECRGRCYDFHLQQARIAEDLARIEEQRKSEKVRIGAFSAVVVLFLLWPGSIFYLLVLAGS